MWSARFPEAMALVKTVVWVQGIGQDCFIQDFSPKCLAALAVFPGRDIIYHKHETQEHSLIPVLFLGFLFLCVCEIRNT